MKNIVLILLVLISSALHAQQVTRIIMHVQSADTIVHKSLVNQISNLKNQIPQAELEVVCHGPGLEFLMKKNSKYVNRINQLNLTDVTFVGCEFTMKQRNLTKDDLVPFAKTVPFGLVEIIKKQQEEWLYVKLGF